MVVNRVDGATIDGEALPQSDRGQRVLGAIGRRDAGSGVDPLHGLAKQRRHGQDREFGDALFFRDGDAVGDDHFP